MPKITLAMFIIPKEADLTMTLQLIKYKKKTSAQTRMKATTAGKTLLFHMMIYDSLIFIYLY